MGQATLKKFKKLFLGMNEKKADGSNVTLVSDDKYMDLEGKIDNEKKEIAVKKMKRDIVIGC